VGLEDLVTTSDKDGLLHIWSKKEPENVVHAYNNDTCIEINPDKPVNLYCNVEGRQPDPKGYNWGSFWDQPAEDHAMCVKRCLRHPRCKSSAFVNLYCKLYTDDVEYLRPLQIPSVNGENWPHYLYADRECFKWTEDAVLEHKKELGGKKWDNQVCYSEDEKWTDDHYSPIAIGGVIDE
jgi:hypothetical protein